MVYKLYLQRSLSKVILQMMKAKKTLIDDDLAPFQIYYIKYPKQYEIAIRKVLGQITQKYANFNYMELNEILENQTNRQNKQIKLTRRKKTLAVLAPFSQENPQSLSQGCFKITLTNKPLTQDDIFISKDSNLQDIEVQLIKYLQLDSVWVGLLYRIGTDYEQLQKYLVQHEHFKPFQVGLIAQFQKILEQRLEKKQNLTLCTLDNCKYQMEQRVIIFNHKVEEHIRANFNSRSVIQDISNHSYLNLLHSRSYFNLIYIQGQMMNRFNHYKAIAQKRFPSIFKILTFQNFMTIDDYVYTQFIFPCLKKVKKFINRTFDSEPYSQIVRKYHRDIIREFRPSLHEYFLSICLVLKERSACLKQAVGSVIVKNRSIISSGYNSTPIGTINCYNGGCRVCNNSQKISTQVLSCRCIHAEYNCILTAGITLTPGATLYSSKLPCLWCAKLIIQGRIKQVIYLQSKYSSLEHQNVDFVKKTYKAAKVELIEMNLHYNE